MLSFNGTRVSNVTFKGTPVKEVCYRKNSACTKIFGTPHNSVCFNNANSPVTVTCTIHFTTWDTCEEYDPGHGDDPTDDKTVYDDDMTINPGDAYIKAWAHSRSSGREDGCFYICACEVPIDLTAAFNSKISNNYGDYTACSRVTPSVTLTSATITTHDLRMGYMSFGISPSISFTAVDGCVTLHGIGNCDENANAADNAKWTEGYWQCGIDQDGWITRLDTFDDISTRLTADLSLTFTITPTWTNTINKTEMTIDSEGRPTCDGSL